MNRLFLMVLPFLVGPAHAAAIPQPQACTSYAYAHITTATNTQLVAQSGTNNIYICDFEFSNTAALTFYLEKSASGTCASPTQIGIAWNLVANQSKAASNAVFRGFSTGASQQLCVNTSAGNLDIGVYYAQQP
jgi:hypothetical protein